MAAEGMRFSWPWNGSTISLIFGVIWEISVGMSHNVSPPGSRLMAKEPPTKTAERRAAIRRGAIFAGVVVVVGGELGLAVAVDWGGAAGEDLSLAPHGEYRLPVSPSFANRSETS